MNRVEPNLLLAVTTGVALALLVMTASVYGPAGSALRYGILAVACGIGFVLLNGPLMKAMKITPRPPMIHPQAASTAVWAALFPLFVIVAAAVPVFWPGHDYGLMIVIASVWFGVTLESALKARRQAG